MQMRWWPTKTAKNIVWPLSLALLIMSGFHGLALAEVTIVQTGKSGDRHRELRPAALAGAPEFTLEVDAANPRQELEGFGASFTESSAWNLACLPEVQRLEVLTRLFAPDEGMGFTLTRTHINSCDYSLRHYSYVEPGDLELKSFSIDEDKTRIHRPGE